MSLRSYRQKVKFLPFKIAILLKKVCCKVSLCENCRRQSCKAFMGQSDWWWTTPCMWNFSQHWPTGFKNTKFQSIFAHSASPVTWSKKFMTDWKSATRFPWTLLRELLQTPRLVGEGNWCLWLWHLQCLEPPSHPNRDPKPCVLDPQLVSCVIKVQSSVDSLLNVMSVQIETSAY